MTAWTRTPPDEAGYYWVRRTDSEGDVAVFLVLAMPQVDEVVFVYGGMETMRLESLGPDVEWWPIPIEPPEEGTP